MILKETSIDCVDIKAEEEERKKKKERDEGDEGYRAIPSPLSPFSPLLRYYDSGFLFSRNNTCCSLRPFLSFFFSLSFSFFFLFFSF